MIKKKENSISTTEMELAIANYFNIRKTGYAVEIEIKTSKSDLLADFKKEHNHVDKQNRIAEFYYAIPDKLYESCKDLIPVNAGIIICYRYNNKIYATIERYAKRIKNARKLTMEEQLKIARLGVLRIWNLKEKILKNGTKKI